MALPTVNPTTQARRPWDPHHTVKPEDHEDPVGLPECFGFAGYGDGRMADAGIPQCHRTHCPHSDLCYSKMRERVEAEDPRMEEFNADMSERGRGGAGDVVVASRAAAGKVMPLEEAYRANERQGRLDAGWLACKTEGCDRIVMPGYLDEDGRCPRCKKERAAA